MEAEPFLCIDTIEVGNAQRTLNYLRLGLGGPEFDVPAHPVTVETQTVINDGYLETYSDIYNGGFTLDHFSPQGLACYCAAYDDSPYVSPANDDAPWYTSARPESGEFLGFVPHEIFVRPTLARTTSAGQLGSSLGPARASGQIMAVNGQMYASSPAGMAYGERWLVDVLSGGLCGGDPDLMFLPACPSSGEAQWRTMRRVGLIDGPVFGRVEGVRSCSMQPVSFQLASESPWLLTDPLLLADEEPLEQGGVVIVSATTDDWVGDAALRITVNVGTGSPGGFFLTGYASEIGDCEAGPVRTCWRWAADLPEGHRLVVDGVERTVEIVNPATGEVVGGMELLSPEAPQLGGALAWPEVAPCSTMCVSVEGFLAPPNTTVTIEQFGREL